MKKKIYAIIFLQILFCLFTSLVAQEYSIEDVFAALQDETTYDRNYTAEDLFHDLKNVSTIGYKAIAVRQCRKFFRDIRAQGAVTETGKNFDFAIIGGGAFFQVTDPKSGQFYYTRNGRFQPNKNGLLTLENGFVLTPNIKVNKKKTIIKTAIRELQLFITYDDNSVQKENIRVYGFKNTSAYNEGLYFTSDEVYELFNAKIYTGVIELSTVELDIELLLLQNCLYKMRDEKKSQTYAAHQIDMINKFFADDIVVYSPDDLYDRTIRENGTLPI